MALLSFRGISTPSLPAQGEQRRSSYFNIPRGNSMMWEIVYADGKPNEFEANTIWRAADLLGVSSRQRVALRQLVEADKTALAM
jgi:hypothetical protein